MARKKGKPNLEDDEMLQKIRDVITGSLLARAVISREMVIAIETGVIKANEQKIFNTKIHTILFY